MKIHEISNFLNVNHETVRMYRKKGFLKPERNPANGYYEYTDDDLFSLFFIRKLRGANLSLHKISQIFASKSVSNMLDDMDQEITGLKNQIKTLERKLDTLTRTRSHLAECTFAQGEVTITEATDAKYDMIDLQNTDNEHLKPWLEQPDLCTISLCIKKELLNQELTGEPIPVSPCLGTYKKIIDRHQLPLLNTMSVCPKGTYLSCLVELDNPTSIPAEKLLPLQEYAKSHGLTFVSNTTAFLISIDRSSRQTKYLFRIRICVEQGS